MSGLISSVAWYSRLFYSVYTANLIFRVKRGVSVQHPTKYILDDEELQRVSTLARIELEDAKAELERAQNASKSMDQRIIAGGEDEDEEDEDEDADAWVE